MRYQVRDFFSQSDFGGVSKERPGGARRNQAEPGGVRQSQAESSIILLQARPIVKSPIHYRYLFSVWELRGLHLFSDTVDEIVSPKVDVILVTYL